MRDCKSARCWCVFSATAVVKVHFPDRNMARFRIPTLRGISTAQTYRGRVKVVEQEKWDAVIEDAEKIIGFSTKYLGLPWVLSREVTTVTSQNIERLMASKHPFLETVKNFMQEGLPSWGLIVLLLSKTASGDKDSNANSQRMLAEMTETIKIGHMIQRGIYNIESRSQENMIVGNKLSLLCGDNILSKSFYEIAKLKNFSVHEAMSLAFRDLSESELVGPRDKQNNPLPSRPVAPNTDNPKLPSGFDGEPLPKNVLGHMKAEWTLRNVLGGASLLGRGCQGSLILNGHGKRKQEIGFSFGRNLALAFQAYTELEQFESSKRFSLVSGPVMFHLESDPGLYEEIEKGAADVENVDYDLIRNEVKAGPGLEKTYQMQKDFAWKALKDLAKFGDSEAKMTLVNIINAM